MLDHKRRTVEWVLRGVELAAVFVAMTWTLLWAATRGRRKGFDGPTDGPTFGATDPGHSLELDDPDGGARRERGRRRRHID